LAELVGDGEDVGSEFGERVGRGAARLAAFVVAALIGNDDAEAGGGERLDLSVPGIPKFREPVEKDYYGAVWGAGGDGVEIDRATMKSYVFDEGWHKCRVYP